MTRWILAVGIAAWAALAPSVASAMYLPPFPAGPARFEVPAGTTASAFIPLPGLCGDGGVLHGQIGKPVLDSTAHAVSHMGFQDLCTPDAGVTVAFKIEQPYTGVVTVTILEIAGKLKDSNELVGSIGPYRVKFYMGVAIPATGGEAGHTAWWGLAALAVGAGPVAASRRRARVPRPLGA